MLVMSKPAADEDVWDVLVWADDDDRDCDAVVWAAVEVELVDAGGVLVEADEETTFDPPEETAATATNTTRSKTMIATTLRPMAERLSRTRKSAEPKSRSLYALGGESSPWLVISQTS